MRLIEVILILTFQWTVLSAPVPLVSLQRRGKIGGYQSIGNVNVNAPYTNVRVGKGGNVDVNAAGVRVNVGSGGSTAVRVGGWTYGWFK